MSNSLAVATVTASLKNVLESALQTNTPDTIDGATVTTLRPAATGMPARGANIFLYQASNNPSLRNEVLPARDSNGTTVKPPQIALDLHYLVSFYGNESKWEPQRCMAIAARTFNSLPILSKNIVSATVQTLGAPGGGSEFLALSDLSDGPQLVRLTPMQISLEELSKLWSILLQEKYVLSLLYVASVVLIDSPEIGVTAMPVLQRNLTLNLLEQPLQVIQVQATDTSLAGAIVAQARVAVTGRGLSASGLVVIIDGVKLNVVFLVQVESRVEFVLPPTLLAGTHTLRMSQFGAASPFPRNESNLAMFQLRPLISGPIGKSVALSSPPSSPPKTVYDGSLSVPVTPAVGLAQRSSLLLNQKNVPAGQTPFGTVLTIRPAPPENTATTNTLVFPFNDLPPGRYLARLRVDDAESPPVPITSPPSSPIDPMGPEVVIP